jgi:hypothetical protein
VLFRKFITSLILLNPTKYRAVKIGANGKSAQKSGKKSALLANCNLRASGVN